MELVAIALATLLCSVWIGYLTVRFAHRYEVGIDRGGASHKAHRHQVSRLGAVPVAGGLVVALSALILLGDDYDFEAMCLGITLLPALVIGLVEDLFQNLGALVRLFATMIAAALGWWLLDARVESLGIGLVDPLLASSVVAGFALTLFAASGVTHSINIVDGCNGLSSFVSMLMLSSLAAVANAVGDQFVFSVSILGAAAILGFFAWNFPFGRLFLGDGGAYLTGLLVAELSIMLVCRNPTVSPWFPLLLAIYPIWETVYSAYRRMFVRGRSPGSPDRLHMHSLVYHRLIKSMKNLNDPRYQELQSSLAAMYMWAFALISAVPAVLFWDRPGILQLACGIFAVVYLILYRNLVRFRGRRLLLLRGRLNPLLSAVAG